MKFIVALILTALLSFAAGLFAVLPWWSFAICAFIVALAVHQRAGKAFLSGFLALALLWGLMALFIDSKNDHILSTKIANLLPLGGSYIVLILVTALIGGLVAGLAAMTGSYLRKR
jgi:cbb3-type cytochrome oxidase subunit 1